MKRTSNARLRRILAMIAALTILLSCLTACQKSKPNDEDTTPVTEATTPTESTTEAPTLPPETTEATEPKAPSVWGTVNTNNLNIRTSPSSTSTIVSQYDAGTRVEILEQQTADGVNWGRIEEGWISLAYVTLDGQITDNPNPDSTTQAPDSTTTETTAPTTPEVSGTATNKTGTITASELNIRKGPGTDYDAVGRYSKGDKVTITETKNGWGKTDKGWVSMKYVSGVSASTSSSSSTSSGTTAKDPKYSTLVTDGSKKSLGTLKITIGALNVRYGPGSNYEVVTMVTKGTSLSYYQKSGDWVRVSDGWIYTKGYTDLGESSDSSSTSTATTGKGTTTSGLNIRKEGNNKAEIVGAYKEGTKITITEVKNGWGKTDKGWVNLNYVKMDSTSTDKTDKNDKTDKTDKDDKDDKDKVGTNTTFKEGKATVKVNSSLTIRKSADTKAEKVGSYKNGDKVTITKVKGEWGQTDKGWINLKYVEYK